MYIVYLIWSSFQLFDKDNVIQKRFLNYCPAWTLTLCWKYRKIPDAIITCSYRGMFQEMLSSSSVFLGVNNSYVVTLSSQVFLRITTHLIQYIAYFNRSSYMFHLSKHDLPQSCVNFSPQFTEAFVHIKASHALLLMAHVTNDQISPPALKLALLSMYYLSTKSKLIMATICCSCETLREGRMKDISHEITQTDKLNAMFTSMLNFLFPWLHKRISKQVSYKWAWPKGQI